LPLSVLHQFA
jgi:hypothetical protein